MEITIFGVPAPHGYEPARNARQHGIIIAALQRATARAYHAERDGCRSCLVQSHLTVQHLMQHLPRRLARNADWMHRHIQMPATRILARRDDEIAAEHD